MKPISSNRKHLVRRKFCPCVLCAWCRLDYYGVMHVPVIHALNPGALCARLSHLSHLSRYIAWVMHWLFIVWLTNYLTGWCACSKGFRTQHGAANFWWHRRGRRLGNKVTCPITRSRTAKVKASWPRDILTAAVERTNRNDDLEGFGAIMEFSSPASAHDAGKRWEGPDFPHSSQEDVSKGPNPQAAATMMKNHFVYRPVELIKWNTLFKRQWHMFERPYVNPFSSSLKRFSFC